MTRYFSQYATDALNLRFEELMDRGRRNQGDTNEKFNMAVLAFRQARYVNGVSKLQRRGFAGDGPVVLPRPAGGTEVPVGSVTNGIHTWSFISREMAELVEKYCGEASAENVADPLYWAKVDTIPDAELWAVHSLRRREMVEWARAYLVGRVEKRGGSEQEADDARDILDPDILTIGFARRLRRTNAATCCCATATDCCACSITRIVRYNSFSPEKRTPKTTPENS